jgi:hypothetical protein
VSNPDLPTGFRTVSGKRRPPPDKEYTVMFRNGFIDWQRTYTRDQLVWVHEGSSWDVVAVKEAANV